MDEKSSASRVHVIRAGDIPDEGPQTEGIVRMAAITRESVGAQRLWFGEFSNSPGARSGRHHHGEAETAVYISSGHFRVYFGENYDEYAEVGPGDCVYIPPYLPHLEANESDEPAKGVFARSPDNIVVALE
jgi:uncharacterized RmlC-like cupin family protein